MFEEEFENKNMELKDIKITLTENINKQKKLETEITDIENSFQYKSTDEYKNFWIDRKLEEKLNLKKKDTATELTTEQVLEQEIKEIEKQINKIKYIQEHDNNFKEEWIKNSDKLKEKIRNMSINDPDYENLDIFLKRMKEHKITSPNLENQFQQFTMSAVQKIYDKTMESYKDFTSSKFKLEPYQIEYNDLFLKNKLLAEKELEKSLFDFHLQEWKKQMSLIYKKENEKIKYLEKEIFELKMNHDKEFAFEWKLNKSKNELHSKIKDELYKNTENENIIKLENEQKKLEQLRKEQEQTFNSKKIFKIEEKMKTCLETILKIKKNIEKEINIIFEQRWRQSEPWFIRTCLESFIK